MPPVGYLPLCGVGTRLTPGYYGCQTSDTMSMRHGAQVATALGG
jgi:hypothetical protein